MEDCVAGVVRQAIVLAAGNGDRFRNGSSHSKLLADVGGMPLLIRTLTTAWQAGITDAHLVVGYDAETVSAAARSGAPAEMNVHCHFNEEWHKENGLSVLAARAYMNGEPFALLMGDHIVDPEVLGRLLRTRSGPSEALLCIDRQPAEPAIADEATKVRLDGDRISAIGKTLERYDALDTGVFLCRASLFDALDASCAAGDSTLSGGIARLAREGLVRGVDIGEARWCDIDTIVDLAAAERLVERSPVP
jgi:1L-myo-inositol 1-phosphate cytidylyltransferase